ncbi:hypothetical protein AGMMS49545_15790 [Betaproteobacteria bacterium]|nr:hypothetical protein AGMMS49545_15790 [Betaproteobacteria bacterium]GHU45249.1 hypothetical protein AGMMS50289_15970 [Betaproteobacteria bacterium]
MSIVRHKADLSKPRALTPELKAELKALAEMPDETIDFSDIPPLDDSFWKNAVRNPYYRPTKTTTTFRLDSDVLIWLKLKGKGYQTRMNEILRQAMLDDIKTAHG